MKKALIITYYWPPAGGAGVQRVLKFAKYLPQFGWQPIILTVENPDCPVIDETLVKDIPEECKVYRTKALEPFELYKKFTGKKSGTRIKSDVLYNKSNNSIKEKISRWIRLNIFIPDAKIGWIPYAFREGIRIIEKENIDIIFSTSPPHTIQVIGSLIAKKSKIKWVSDYRDPWLELIHYQANKRLKIVKYFESHLEKKILKSSDHIITVSNAIKTMFYNKVKNKEVSIIPNGYDITDINYDLEINESNEFRIAYTGIISETKIPLTLFKVLQKLKTEGIENIKLVFAGNICENCTQEIKNHNLNYEFMGYLPHNESVNLLLHSQLLLLLIDNIPNNKGILTGKLFEYMGTKRSIIGFGPPDGDASKILNESDCGKMINYDNFDETYNYVKFIYNNWQNNISTFKFNVEDYSRKNLTKQLSKIFNNLIEI